MKNNFDASLRARRTYFNISLVFFILAVSLQLMMWVYWERMLEPRLRLEAESQANVLAYSQSFKLASALSLNDADKRRQILQETIAEILLF